MNAIMLAAMLFQEGGEAAKWIRALEAEELAARDEAADALVRLGDDAEPALQRALEKAGIETRGRIEAVLRRIAESRAARERRVIAEKLPQRWPGGTYTILYEGREDGTITFKTEIVDRDGQRVLKLTQTCEAARETSKMRLEATVVCALDWHLPLVEAAWEMSIDKGGGANVARGKFRAGKNGLEAETMGGAVALKAGDLPLATDLSVAHLASFVPFREGAEVRIDYLRTIDDRVRIEPGQVLRCVGREAVSAGGKDCEAWKIEHARPAKGRAPDVYWFRDDGFLLRAKVRSTEYVLKER